MLGDQRHPGPAQRILDHHPLRRTQRVGLLVMRRQQHHPRRLTPATSSCTRDRPPRRHCARHAPARSAWKGRRGSMARTAHPCRIPDPRRRKDASHAQAAGAPLVSGPADKAPGFEPAELIDNRVGARQPDPHADPPDRGRLTVLDDPVPYHPQDRYLPGGQRVRSGHAAPPGTTRH